MTNSQIMKTFSHSECLFNLFILNTILYTKELQTWHRYTPRNIVNEEIARWYSFF